MSEEQPPARPKLIVPGTEPGAGSNKLVVPDDASNHPVPQLAIPADEQPPMTPANVPVVEEQVAQETEEVVEPVKIAEMTPPPAEEDGVVVEAAAAEAAAAEAAAAEAAAAEAAAAEAAAAEAAAAAEVFRQQQEAQLAAQQQEAQLAAQQQEAQLAAQQQEAQQVQIAAQQLAAQQQAQMVAQQQAQMAAQQQAQMAAQQQVYGQQGMLPPGMQQQGAPMVGQPKGIPGWAIFLIGFLAALLISIVVFKFTPVGEGLIGEDLKAKGWKKIKQSAEEETE